MDFDNKNANNEARETPDIVSPSSKPIKGRKFFVGLAIFTIILAVIAACFFNNDEREPRLSIRQAVNVFAREGIYLTQISDPEAKEIYKVKPITYSINNTENKLRIYHYNSIGERKTAWDKGFSEREKSDYSLFHNKAKNLMFIVVPVDEINITKEDYALLGQVSETIFEKLNDTQEVVLTGSSKNWESQTVAKYYEYFYKEEDGTLNIESYCQESTLIKYLGKDTESIGDISFAIQRPSGKTSGTGQTLDKDGTFRVGSSGRSKIPRGDEEYYITIKWNNQEETFVARFN